MVRENDETGKTAAALRPHKATASRPWLHQHSLLCIGVLILAILLLSHITLFRRVTQLGSLVCQQQQPVVADMDALLNLQHLRVQRASLQCDVARRMTPEQPQLATQLAGQEAVSQNGTAHALTVPLTLFIGILSHSPAGRGLSRKGWLNKSTTLSSWKAKFVTFARNATAAEQEQKQYGDLLLTGDHSSLHQTLYIMQYALVHFDVQFIMKAEDTSYIRVDNLLQVLQACCTNTACHNEGLYIGHEIKNSSVFEGGHGEMPQSSQKYLEHTHLKTHMPYMSGAGYILSSDLGRAVIDIARRSDEHDWLFELGRDDMTIGFWLMSLDIHRVNHSGILTSTQGCCFHLQQDSMPYVADSMLALHSITTGARMESSMRSSMEVCQHDLILLSPIGTPQEVAHVQESLQSCAKLDKLHDVAVDVAHRRTKPCKPLLRHGKVRRLSHGNQQDQFLLGSYSTSPWSPSGSMMLALKPKAQDSKLSIGLLKASNATEDDTWYWEHLDTSWAWNSHQGPQLQWLGETDRYIVFNDGRCHGIKLNHDPFCAVIFDIQRLTRARVLPLPVHTVSPDGLQGLHVSFGRQELAQAGRGYRVQEDLSWMLRSWASQTDGLWLMNMFSGHTQLLISLWTLSSLILDSHADTEAFTKLDGQGTQTCLHWLSKPQFNQHATLLAFLDHMTNCSSDTAGLHDSGSHSRVRLVTTDIAGQNIWVLPFEKVLHYDYGRRGSLLVSTQHGLFEANALTRSIKELKPPTTVLWSSLSHCSYHQHSERFVLAVTAGPQQKEIVICDRWTNHVHMVGLYSARRDRTSFLHNELHPMWAPDGCTLAFDSTHTGQGWQVFVAGVSGLEVDLVMSMAQINSGPNFARSSKQQSQHMLLDLGSGSGLSIKQYLHSNKARQHDIQVHAFEPDPMKFRQLRKAVTDSKLKQQTVLHDTAIWIANEQVPMSAINTGRNQNTVGQGLYTHLCHLFAELARHNTKGQSARPIIPALHTVAQSTQDQILVQATDLSQWLFQNTKENDFVAVQMDIAGAEFDVIEQLILDGSMLLIDDLSVVWHDELRPASGRCSTALERLAEKLGTQCSGKQASELQKQ